MKICRMCLEVVPNIEEHVRRTKHILFGEAVEMNGELMGVGINKLIPLEELRRYD